MGPWMWEIVIFLGLCGFVGFTASALADIVARGGRR